MRKSSLGLILGIFTHLILLLARFTKPLNKQDKRVMKLEGRIMFPSADVSLSRPGVLGHVKALKLRIPRFTILGAVRKDSRAC